MDNVTLKSIIADSLSESIGFEAYTAMLENLAAEGKTTGPKQDEDWIYYTKLNAQRSRRLNKTAKVPDEVATLVEKLNEPYTWLVLTESWCGDAAQIIPLFQKMAELNPNINLRLVLRDENDALMSQFKTNGGRAIPKLIILDQQLEVMGSWGPRPVEAQNMSNSWRNDPNRPPYKEFQIELQKWYLKDRGLSTFQEVSEILQELETPVLS